LARTEFNEFNGVDRLDASFFFRKRMLKRCPIPKRTGPSS
jgi:hypothetical protein